MCFLLMHTRTTISYACVGKDRQQAHAAARSTCTDAVGGRSSVVRALVAQASDLGLIPSGFPVLFYIPLFPFQSVYNIVSTSY